MEFFSDFKNTIKSLIYDLLVSEESSHVKKPRSPKMKKTLHCLFQVFIYIRYYLDLLIDKLFGFYYDPQRAFIAKIKNPILLESASSLSKKIQKREITSEEVVQAFIDRIKEVNPVINAIVDDRFEEALIEAKQIDLDIASGTIQEVDFQEKPFLGKPRMFNCGTI